MTKFIDLEPTRCFVLRNRSYDTPRAVENGFVVRDCLTGRDVKFTHSQITSAKNARQFWVRPEPIKSPPRGKVSRPSMRRAQSKALSDGEVHHRIEHLAHVFAQLKAGRGSLSAAGLQAALASSSDEPLSSTSNRRKARSGSLRNEREPPCARTIRRWTKTLIEHGLSGLRPAFSRQGNRASRYPYEVVQLVNRFATAYADEKRPTMKSLWDELAEVINARNEKKRTEYGERAKPLPIPSMRYFCKRVREQDQFEQYAARHGVDKARAKFFAAQGGPKATKPLERCEADDFRIDFQKLNISHEVIEFLKPSEIAALERVRLWMTVIIDVATRYVLAVVLTHTPSTDSALRALKMALIDKTVLAAELGCASSWAGGHVGELFLDNATNFVNDEVMSAAETLGVILSFCPAGRPQFKGTVERLSKTLTGEIMARFSGRTFENSVARGDYPAEQRAVLTVDEFIEALVLGTVDIYHNSPHRGLKGETPANAWKRLTDQFGTPEPPQKVQIVAAFGAEYERVTGINGVTFNGLWYQGEALQRNRLRHGDQAVTIRVDHEDLSEIAVLTDGSWVTVPAVDQETASTSLAQLQFENELLNREHAHQAEVSARIVARARQRLRDTNKHAVARARLAPFGDGEKLLRSTKREVTLAFRTIDAPASTIRELGAEFPATGREADRAATIETSRAPTRPTHFDRSGGTYPNAQRPGDWKIED